MSKRYLCMTNVGGSLPKDLYKGSVVTADKLGDQATINRLTKLEAIRETDLPLRLLDTPDPKIAADIDAMGAWRTPDIIPPAVDQDEAKALHDEHEDDFPPVVSPQTTEKPVAGIPGVTGTSNAAVATTAPPRTSRRDRARAAKKATAPPAQ